ncbi:MAG: hypothetical protein COT74_09960 [Bdellovibrionales bacterium CG10_big_fil_rev_8_21_14_0_10_45_34]|nr:MAG: hypothetical protein COT74_09960 [Bdellovibrionales bacterium CG10_big_fil_rev_8_21_14_0_10_45_34]
MLLCFVFVTIFTSNSYAQRFVGFDSGESGVALLVGKPSVVRYTTWANWRQNWNFDVGYDFEQVAIAGVSHAYYFYDVDDLWKRSRRNWNTFLFYAGAGLLSGLGLGTVDTNDKFRLGVRGFGGFEYLFSGGPWSLKGEVGPALYFTGRTTAGIIGMIGVAYYFGSSDKVVGKKKARPVRKVRRVRKATRYEQRNLGQPQRQEVSSEKEKEETPSDDGGYSEFDESAFD